MPDRETLKDPTRQAPLPGGWPVIQIVVGVIIVVVILVTLMIGLLTHHGNQTGMVNLITRLAA